VVFIESRPSFFHIPESRLGRWLSPAAGDEGGGVVGLSAAGLSVLPLSSVMPGPLPVPDRLGSEPEATASMLVVVDMALEGDDVDCVSFALKRDLLVVEIGEGAPRRIDGAE